MAINLDSLTSTLRKRYGAGFDMNSATEGIPYFQRRDAETQAEGDPRDAAYWDMRASGVNEAQYAIDEAQKGYSDYGWNAPQMNLNAAPTDGGGVNYAGDVPLPQLTQTQSDPVARQRQAMRREALMSQLR